MSFFFLFLLPLKIKKRENLKGNYSTSDKNEEKVYAVLVDCYPSLER